MSSKEKSEDLLVVDQERDLNPEEQEEKESLSKAIEVISDQIGAMDFIITSLLRSMAQYSTYSQLGGTELFKNLLDWQYRFNEQMSQAREVLKLLWEKQMDISMACVLEYASSKNPDDYLVVEDEEKVSTFHLQVKRNGKPDRNLCGAAWAALHQGHRGNKYKGPDKQKAIKKLKSIYEKEGWPLPNEK